MQIADEKFKICNDCDNKLNLFYQFRIDAVRVQHEFADILKSIQSSESQYEQEYYGAIRDVSEQNLYSNVYDQPVQPSQDYQHNIYLDHELHLALDDDNHNDNHSLISIPNDNIYQTQIQTPQIISHHHHHDDEEIKIENPPLKDIIEEPVENHYIETAQIQHVQESQPIGEIEKTENDIHHDDDDDFNDFPYDDFDESCQSPSGDRTNVDNAIDKKIEEFIQNKRSKANPKICHVCNKLFRTNYKLREHMQTHAENNAKFICDFAGCAKAFKSKIGLKEHAARHSGEHNFTCDICHKKFLLRSYFVAHKKIHSNIKEFSCTMCSKTFKSKQNLVNHENFHYGLKSFTCETCQKSFTTKTNLDVHMKSHSLQSDQFECSVCKKFFRTKAYLKIHIKTHYKSLQNYACFCGKTFIQLCDLKIHSRTHSNQKDELCETCGMCFSRKDSLKLHISSAHTKDTTFECKKCQKRLTRKASLNKHMKKCLAEKVIIENTQ